MNFYQSSKKKQGRWDLTLLLYFTKAEKNKPQSPWATTATHKATKNPKQKNKQKPKLNCISLVYWSFPLNSQGENTGKNWFSYINSFGRSPCLKTFPVVLNFPSINLQKGQRLSILFIPLSENLPLSMCRDEEAARGNIWETWRVWRGKGKMNSSQQK